MKLELAEVWVPQMAPTLKVWEAEGDLGWQSEIHTAK
jgi:hypothetical protein